VLQALADKQTISQRKGREYSNRCILVRQSQIKLFVTALGKRNSANVDNIKEHHTEAEVQGHEDIPLINERKLHDSYESSFRNLQFSPYTYARTLYISARARALTSFPFFPQQK
jgi:hypothetical protein